MQDFCEVLNSFQPRIMQDLGEYNSGADSPLLIRLTFRDLTFFALRKDKLHFRIR